MGQQLRAREKRKRAKLRIKRAKKALNSKSSKKK
jgi:hypothetical protein